MHFLKSFKRILFVLIFFSAAFAWGKNGKYIGSLQISAQVNNTFNLYHFDGTSGKHSLQENHWELLGEVKSTGLLGGNDRKIDQVEERVPGVDYQGFQFIEIVKSASGLILGQQFKVNDLLDGVPTATSLNLTLNLHVANGNISDFLEGKSADFFLDQNGREEYARAWVEALLKIIEQQALFEIENKAPDVKLRLEPKLLKVKAPNLVEIKSSGDQITLVSDSYGFAAEFKAYYLGAK